LGRRARGDASAHGGSSPRAAAGETFTLLRRYLIQETFGPLKGILRSLAFGLAGALLLGVGAIVLLLAVLRVLQTETGSAFAGTWSFAPFLITALTALVAAGGASFVGLRSARRSGHDEGEHA
jgi:hypothetical protein